MSVGSKIGKKNKKLNIRKSQIENSEIFGLVQMAVVFLDMMGIRF